MTEHSDDHVAHGDDAPWPTMFPRDEYDGARLPSDSENDADEDGERDAEAESDIERLQERLKIANDTHRGSGA